MGQWLDLGRRLRVEGDRHSEHASGTARPEAPLPSSSVPEFEDIQKQKVDPPGRLEKDWS
jgi:hypothetical protein